MRILQVIKDLDEGGAQVVVQHLVHELAGRGHEVAVAAMPGRLSPLVPAAHYVLPPTGGSPRLLPAAAAALFTAVHEFVPDVVHCHNPGTMLATTVATARGRRVPALVTLHGSPQKQYRANAVLARACGMTTVACGPAVATLMDRAGAPVDATVLNGVSVVRRRPREAVRADLGIGPDEFVVVQVGRLTAQKNPVLAVEGFAAAGGPGHLLFAGTGELAGEVQETAQHLRVADRVQLLGARSDVGDLLGSADVVQLTSTFEGLPLALLEAMSVGAATLGVRAEGISELIMDDVDGVLVAPTAEAIATALRRLARDPALRQRLGRAALERAEHFTAARMVRDYEAIYSELVR